MTTPPPSSDPTATPAPDEGGAGDAVPGSTTAPARRRSAATRTVLLGLALVAAVIAGAVVAGGLVGDEPAAPPPGQAQASLEPVSRAESVPLPEAELAAFADAEPVTTTDYRGTPLVVNFWATWCTPCVVEMPDFEEVFTGLDGRVAFLGVNSQDRADAAERFVDELGITYDLASDPRGDYFEEVGGFGWPTTLLVDVEGTIRYRHTGPLEADRLLELLDTHLGVEQAR